MSINQPIKPDEVSDAKLEHTPIQIIQAVNELIAKKYSDGRAVIHQFDIIDLTLSKYSDRLRPSREAIIAWLNIEEIYRDAGWEVEYNSDHPSYFIFKKTKSIPVWRS